MKCESELREASTDFDQVVPDAMARAIAAMRALAAPLGAPERRSV